MRTGLKGVLMGDDQARMLPGFEARGKWSESDKDGQANRRRDKGRGGQQSTARSSNNGGAGSSQDAGDNRPLAAKAGGMSKEARMRENTKKVFYFDDGKFSMMTRLIDWPKVCAKYGWDATRLCGPAVMSHALNRDTNCMDAAHR